RLGGHVTWEPAYDSGIKAARLDAPTPQSAPQTSSNHRPRCLENPRRAVAELSSLPKPATLHFTLNQESQRKWGLGPVIGVFTQPKWGTIGFIVQNTWSVAGDSNREKVNKG